LKPLSCLLAVLCCLVARLCAQSLPAHTLQPGEPPRFTVVAEAFQRSLTTKAQERAAPLSEPAAKMPAAGNALRKQPPPAPPRATRTAALPACVDSSYRKLFAAANRVSYVYTMLQTRDGGVVVGGASRDTLEGSPWKYYAYLAKFDSDGRVLWAKEYRGQVSFEMDLQVIYEMKDGSLVVAGDYNNELFYQPNRSYYDALVMKLTADGALIWSKTFHSTQTTCTNSTSVYIQSIDEGRDGELLLGGTVINCPYPLFELAVKLDAAGNLQWSQSFRHTYDGNGFGIYYHNNEAVLVGKSGGYYSGSDGTVNIHFLRMDYATGDTLGQKRWRLDAPYWGPSGHVFIGNMKTRRLNNGHFAVYGRLYGDYNYDKDTTNHFGVVEFDDAFRYVKGYTINSPIRTNTYNDYIHVAADGRVQFAVFGYLGSYGGRVYFGSLAPGGQFLNQRRKTYTGVGMPGQGGFASYADGSYAYLQTHYSTADRRFYIEYTRMHNSDTASDCLGQDTAFAHLIAVNYIPVSWPGLDSVRKGTIYETPHSVSARDILYDGIEGCPQTSFCDTLRIRRADTICNARQEVWLAAYKNPECGAWVTWRLSDPAVAGLRQENDSTVGLRFLVDNWQGYLVGELPGKCGAVTDSVFLAVQQSPGAFSLGKDTAICPGNTLELKVKKGYTTYRWQDGSADSVLVVRAPGLYHITVEDACGQQFSDTLAVAAAPPIPFSAGPDRTKCNNDTVHLRATAGFLNYSWAPDYRISATNTASIVVNPLQDTVYYVRAEKTRGCFAYDTVAVTVHQAAPIDLGRDTSFCSGDSVVLAAAPGFVRYRWGGGETGASVTAYGKGAYSVQAWDAHGCPAADTLRVMEVYANPVVRLNGDSLLCLGDSRLLEAGAGYAAYRWSDGSMAPDLPVRDTGTYGVRVVDRNGCAGDDTIRISRLLPVPDRFLPADTSLCSYGSLQLRPLHSFAAYRWSTGATTPVLTTGQAGTYWLEVRDSYGCTGRDTIILHPKQCLEGLYAPSAFSPNRDGKNDVFRPLLFGNVLQYQFAVYNKWGENVFQTNDPQKGWDGTVKSRLSDTHVFVWTCRYQLAGQEPKMEKGTVTLIR
jgi:gliding motility-associated-like protein